MLSMIMTFFTGKIIENSFCSLSSTSADKCEAMCSHGHFMTIRDLTKSRGKFLDLFKRIIRRIERF